MAATRKPLIPFGRYLSVMETRAEHCRQEAARYAQRAKRAQSKIDRTNAMVLYYLESHDLKQVESDDFTLRRQKNSQDSVTVSNPDVIPPDLKRYELKVAGDLWMKVFLALPEELAAALQAPHRSSRNGNAVGQEGEAVSRLKREGRSTPRKKLAKLKVWKRPTKSELGLQPRWTVTSSSATRPESPNGGD